MGCMSSKQAQPDLRLRRRRRSLSLPIVHGSSIRKADNNSNNSIHIVSLTFSTLGSLSLSPTESHTIINSWELMEGLEDPHTCPSPKFPGIVKARVAAFQQKIDAGRSRGAAKGRVVVYTTSLRGVRKTYEDCRNVRARLERYGVRIEERDLSMDGGFKEELREILDAKEVVLPRVFADGRCLGGAEEVEELHEKGELKEALKGCEDVGGLRRLGGCEGCGEYGFVLCGMCSGSCKMFVEEGGDGVVGGFSRCVCCNENGLVRCPVCC